VASDRRLGAVRAAQRRVRILSSWWRLRVWAQPETIPGVTDDDFMDLALRHADEAFARGDWPVGSVLVRDGAVLGTGQNRQNTERDVTWHAEFEAIRQATRTHGANRVAGAAVYSTMEPCPMCAGAMKLAGIRRLVLGARHAALGRIDMGDYSVETFCRLAGYDLALTAGVREAECMALRRRWGRDQVRPG
jgi:tRNA(Arg) A34 adenosine deaminase TadA